MTLAIDLLSKYGLSAARGFLPHQTLLDAFPDPYYADWDDLISKLPHLLSSHNLTTEVEKLPILSTNQLTSEPQLHRAYVVLSFLIHAHVWGSSRYGRPTEIIPAQLSEPYLDVCEKLDVLPVITYAALCLWNWLPRKDVSLSDEGFLELEQLKSVASFMDSRAEDAFYHVPVLIEAEGGPLVALLLDAIDHAAKGDVAAVVASLNRSTKTLGRMVAHLPKLYSTLDVDMFFHQLRPFLAGGKGMEEKGLSRGFVFQKSDGSQMAAQYSGGSAVQSSLFPFLDIALGVEHKTPANGSKSLFQEMRSYMPKNHREFLASVSEFPSLRSFVQQHAAEAELCESFDACLKQLRLWRSTHIAVVSKYIVQPARREASQQDKGTSGEATAADSGVEIGGELQGTGGSALIPFLKLARDETKGL